jgi:hypothetical protein
LTSKNGAGKNVTGSVEFSYPAIWNVLNRGKPYEPFSWQAQHIHAQVDKGIKRIILPERNKADLEDIPADVTSELEFVLASRMDQVLEAALDGKIEPKVDAAVVAPAN